MGLTTGFLICLIAGFVGAALILVVAGLAVGSGIFCVGGLDLRFSFGELVLKFGVLIALVLIVLFVLGGAFPALVLARIVPRAAFAGARVVAARVLHRSGPSLALALAR